MKNQALIICFTVLLIGCSLKNNSKIVDTQNELLKEVTTKYYGDRELGKNEGIYNIDSTKSNLHIYSDFKFLLKEDSQTTKLIFLSCEKYGYSHTWSEGELFGIIDSIKDEKSNLYYGRINEHRGEERKELTPHDIKIDDAGVTVFTGKHQDVYAKIYPLK